MAPQKRHRICVICGTRERHKAGATFFARFPLDENRCKEWLKVVGNQDLVHLPIEKLHDLKYVCEKHFIKKDFTKTGTRLKKRAIPKLHLTAIPLTDDCFLEFPLHIGSDPVPSKPKGPVDTNAAGSSSAQFPSNLKHDPIPSKPKGPVDTNAAGSSSAQFPANLKHDPIPSKPKGPVDTNAAGSSSAQFPANPKHDPIPSKPKGPVDTNAAGSSSAQFPANPKHDPVPSTSKRHIYTELPSTKRRKVLAEIQLPNATVAYTSKQNMNKTEDTLQAVKPTDLGPREKQLVEQLKKAKSTIKSLKKNAKLIENIQSPILKEIIEMALKNQKRKSRGRRWSPKYKISLLAIYKRSPKAFKYLQHLVTLPSINTLQNILKKVPMEPGICHQGLLHLEKQQPKNKLDKYCCLLFDEMAIKPRLSYNSATDQVEGFVDFGNGERSAELADHALVFMIQGIRKKYKQPIAFYFVKGTVTSAKLASLIMVIIKEIFKTGYHVLTTVCDQGPTNMGALKILKQLTVGPEDNTTDDNYFLVNNNRINIIYDVPHLFKSIRNNFMNYGEMRVDGQTAKWEHIKKVEEKNRSLLYLSKITQTHVEPKYRAKMKVKYAAQVLSNTVAAVLKLLALAENDPLEASQLMETGIIVEKLDKLFDITNGPSGPDDVKKGLRRNVSNQSNHLKKWTESRKMLETVKFVKTSSNTRAKNVRCVQGFLTTLCSLRDIWTKCNSLGFKYLNLRQLNQDSLENLFGLLRQHSPTNKNPTVASFIAGMKTTIISKMTAPHSRGSNCQKDSNFLLTDFHDLVFENEECKENIEKEHSCILEAANECTTECTDYPVLSFPEIDDEEEKMEKDLINVDIQPVVYLSGYIVHCIFKKHDCVACSEALLNKNPIDPLYEYIKLREWWQNKRCLTYPSLKMIRYIEENVNIFEKEIMSSIHTSNIRLFTVTVFMAKTNALFLTCNTHQKLITNAILTRLALILIRRQCGRINKSISQEEEKIKDLEKKNQQKGVDKNEF